MILVVVALAVTSVTWAAVGSEPGSTSRARVAASPPRRERSASVSLRRTKSASSRRALTPQPLGVGGHWRLILNAQFNGRSLNTHLWRAGWFGTGITGPINKHELACYSSSNVTLPGDGTAHLNVTAVPQWCGGEDRPYTGALLSTNPADGRTGGGFQYRYGLLQAEVYVPGSGSRIADWPGVVTLGQMWPQDGEDDVLEGVKGEMCFHFHTPAHKWLGVGGCDIGFSAGWHTIAADWEPHSITWYYDGVKVGHESSAVTSAPMYITIGDSVSSKALGVARPASLRVAYVRVWQRVQSADR